MIIFDDSDKKAAARFEQILEALQEQDKDALKAMFTVEVRSEPGFDEDLDALFSYVEGDIQSWEKGTGFTYDDYKKRDGNRLKFVQSRYVFTTSEYGYRIAIYEYTIDTVNPDNVGVYSLCILKTKVNPNPAGVYWGSGEAGIQIDPKKIVT